MLTLAPTHSGKLALALSQSGELNSTLPDLDRTWGTSNEWFIDLRDGRQLWLLMDIQQSVVGQHSLEDEDPTTQKLIQWLVSQQDSGKSDTDAEME